MGFWDRPAARRLRRINGVVPDLKSIPGVLGRIARRRLSSVASIDYDPALTLPEKRASFREALAAPGLAVIAEIKRKSPSKGEIADLDAAEVALAYKRGGARAISVLTEPEFFGGSDEDLLSVARAVDLPLLRKDFVVHPRQVWQARALGASAVLLIAAILGSYTAAYVKEARNAGLDALLEVHDERELEAAILAGADIIGINNRDLTSLEVNIANAPRLAQRARQLGYEGLLVAESGYYEQQQLQAIAECCDAVLIGSSLAASADPQAALEKLLRG